MHDNLNASGAGPRRNVRYSEENGDLVNQWRSGLKTISEHPQAYFCQRLSLSYTPLGTFAGSGSESESLNSLVDT